MNIFWLSNILAVVSNFSIVIFILLTSWKKTANRVFAGIATGVAIWGLSAAVFAKIPQSNYDLALFWWQVSMGGVIFVPVFFAHFIFEFLELRKKSFVNFTYLAYLFGLIFLFFNFYNNSRFFIGGLKFIFNQFYWADWFKYKSLIFLFFYIGFYWLLLSYSVFLLIRTFKKTKGSKRTQIGYIILASFIGWPGAHGNFLLVFGINLYPYLNFLATLYTLIIAYAILRYRLMDIKFFVKEATIFGIAVGIFVLFAFWVGQTPLGHSKIFIIKLITYLGIGLISFFIGRLIFKKIYAKEAAYQLSLRRTTDDISKIKSLKRLLRISTVTVYINIPVEQVSILYLEPREKEYILAYSKGKKKLILGQRVSPQSPLVQWFKDLRHSLVEMKLAKKEDIEVLAFEELNFWLKTDKLRRERDLWRTLIKLRMQLKKLNTSLCVPGFCKGELVGIMLLGNKVSGDLFTQKDYDLLCQLAAQVSIAADNLLITRHDQDLSFDIFLFTAEAMGAKDTYTRYHSEFAAKLCRKLAEKVQYKRDYKNVEDLVIKSERTGLVHDIGKLKIKDEILNKPVGKKLTNEEWDELKRHPEYGAKMFGVIRAISPDIIEGILYHQEKWDGTGYPKGLKGRQIPPLARIAKLADSFEAMISIRVYKKQAMTIAEAAQEIKRCEGKDFDPDLVEAFLELYKEGKIEKLVNEATQKQ